MAIYSCDSKLSEIILEDPAVIQVMNRFGILLGVGDQTVESVCIKKGIDRTLFLAIINTFLNRDYFPDSLSSEMDLLPLMEYLHKTDKHYKEILLPNIERHFALLLSKSTQRKGEYSEDEKAGKRDNLKLLEKFFLEVRAEMLEVINKDVVDRDEMLEEKISDLINFFVVYLKGDYDCNLCVAVVQALHTLLKDVQQNTRIRHRILKPLCQQ